MLCSIKYDRINDGNCSYEKLTSLRSLKTAAAVANPATTGTAAAVALLEPLSRRILTVVLGPNEAARSQHQH
jgi:hypothetical protein